MILTLYELQTKTIKNSLTLNELIIRFGSKNKNLAFSYSYVYYENKLDISSSLVWSFVDLEDIPKKLKSNEKKLLKYFENTEMPKTGIILTSYDENANIIPIYYKIINQVSFEVDSNSIMEDAVRELIFKTKPEFLL